MQREDYRELLERMGARDDALYERYGKPMEAEHKGEWVAIGPDGALILGYNDIEVLQQAIERFGSGTFAYRRVGYRTIGKIRLRGESRGRS